MPLTFIIGGARSGKSVFAQQLAQQRGNGRVWFVATLRESDDDEMQRRIKRHQASRPAAWPTTVLGDAWREQLQTAPPMHVGLLDCMSLFVSGALFMREHAPTDAEDVAESLTHDLLAAMRGTMMDWIVVSNEMGMSVVPESASARAYRDALGRANQTLMRAADEAWLLVAGAPVKVK